MCVVLMCEPKRERRRGVEMCVFVFCACARAAKMAGQLCSGVFMCLFVCVCVSELR